MKQRFAFLVAAIALLSLVQAWPAAPLHAQSSALTTTPVAGEARLTSFGDVISLAWSPDASRLLFTRSTSVIPVGTGWQTMSDLWEVPATGGAPKRLATNAAEPAYSPDGHSIAYLSLEPDGKGRLWLLSGDQRTDLGPADWGSAPVWSRDGASVQVQRGGQPVGLDRQGRTVPSGISVAAALPPEARAAAFSFDGSRVAYLVFGEAGPELWVAGGGAEARLLLRGELEFFGRPAWSPDGRTLVLSRTPSGSETAPYEELWLVAADGSAVTRLSDNLQEDGQPAWSPDGRGIAFLRGGDIWVRGTTPDAPPAPAPVTEEQRRNRPVPPALESLVSGGLTSENVTPLAALTPPATIVVSHSANFDHNWCPGYYPPPTVTLPFEQYLKWVVPSEMGAGQPTEALRAQAVAARTYAWLRTITHKGWGFDVTDWTEYQAMCPNRADPRTDAAVDATAGQYVSYAGNVANTMYAAEPGDPTWSSAGTPYLTAVDDPVRFGQKLYGHGYGMSQRGAYDWARIYGWSYQQILTHYYTGVTVQLPFSATVNMNPLVSEVLPWANWWVNSNRTLLVANATDDRETNLGLSFTVTFAGGSTVTLSSNGSLLDLSAVGDQSSIQVTSLATEPDGHWSSSTATWGLDRDAPSGSLAAPAFTAIPTVTLNLSASHTGPAGPVSMTLSNDWRWSAALSPVIGHNAGSGAQVADPDSLYGTSWKQTAGVAPNSRSFGPFAILESGKGYRAWFRLKTDNVTTASEVAYLEAIDSDTLDVIGLKRVRGIDFRQANVYQDFFVDFYPDHPNQKLEFPMTFRGTANLWFDRVMATTFPSPLAATVIWAVPAGEGPKQVQARYVDRADNISPDYNSTVTIDLTPPTATATSPEVAPASKITVTWSGSDALSGVASYDLQVRDGEGAWQTWLTHVTYLSDVYSGASHHLYSFRARATDNVGNTGDYREAADTATLADGELSLRPLAAGWNLIGVPLQPVRALTAQSLWF